MKIREWDKISLIFKNDPKKELFEMIALNATTINRLMKRKKPPFKKEEILDLTYKDYPNHPYAEVFKCQDPLKGKHFIVVATEPCMDLLFKFKHKIKNWIFNCKLWFTSIVNKKPYFKKSPTKKN